VELGLSESQKMLKNSARGFLERECPSSLVRALEEDPNSYRPELWKNIADLGWLGLPFPEEYGGLGLSYIDLALLLEEMGRVLFPGVFFSSILGGLSILIAGSSSQKEEILPRIAHGDTIATLALMEPSADYGPAGIQATATRRGSSYLLSGTKLFVPDAQAADQLIVAARTRKVSVDTEGISLFIVDAHAPGVQITPLVTIAADRQTEVQFTNVHLPVSAVLGEVDGGWSVLSRIIDIAAVGKCSEMLGGEDRVLEMTVKYVKERTQFGRPVGSFQAVQHHCANMATAVEGSRFVTYQAAWLLSEGLPATREVAIAKAWVNDAYRQVCALAHQCHGAIGFTREYDLQLYTRRAEAAEVSYGDADHYREVVAQSIGL
jgi:alkylation response protein AidB-like acyl-CoA dehydrogenase